MGILTVILLVFFVVNALLLILLVLVQNDDGGGIGGMFAGGSTTVFGSRSGNFLTRATTVLGSLFLVISFSLALISRTPTGSGVEEEARRLFSEETGLNWLDEELNPSINNEINNNLFFHEDIFNINENFLNFGLENTEETPLQPVLPQ